MDCDIENTSSQDLNCNVQHVVLSSSGLPAVTCPCKAPGEQARSPVRGEWLTWIMRVLKTTPELLEERHSNPWFALFLALCFPSMVAGMMVRSTLQVAPRLPCTDPFYSQSSDLYLLAGTAVCSWLGNELASILVWHPGRVHSQHLLGTVPAPFHRGINYEAIRHSYLVSDCHVCGHYVPHRWHDAGGDNPEVCCMAAIWRCQPNHVGMLLPGLSPHSSIVVRMTCMLSIMHQVHPC